MITVSWNSMKILHMRKQWIPGPSFFFPACLPAREKRGTGDEARFAESLQQEFD